MSLVMGAASYVVGLIPLSTSLSNPQLYMLSSLGKGLLVGTALGVIIPEGIEETVSHDSRPASYSFKIAIFTLLGFAFMFIVEEYISRTDPSDNHKPQRMAFDMDLETLEQQGEPAQNLPPSGGVLGRPPPALQHAYPLSLGLVIHALVDGYALGVSTTDTHSVNLSLAVFFAIIVHKAPTALALTSSLVAHSVPPVKCRKLLLYFSLATPASSVLTHAIYSLASDVRTVWSGGPLLFSGGTFLYVATVLQPASNHVSERSLDGFLGSKPARSILLMAGMFLPVVVSQLLGHGH
ncbi:Zinc/iron permease [Phlebopus sp. FC_14]|nr:Zinc/iron permease [Phlebopus sp. FC_14]